MQENIADAFLAMLANKSADSITVKDLVEYCNISRQSFYYHFQDIMDVVEWVVERIYKGIVSSCLEADTLEEEIHILVKRFVEHYELLACLRDSQKRDLVDYKIIESVQAHLRIGWQQVLYRTGLRGADTDALIGFYSFGLTGLMMARCQEKKPDADELSRQIYRITQQFFPNLDQ